MIFPIFPYFLFHITPSGKNLKQIYIYFFLIEQIELFLLTNRLRVRISTLTGIRLYDVVWFCFVS